MGSCSYCDAFILIGSKNDATGTYCSAKCQQAGNLLALSVHVPQEEIQRRVQELYYSNCPRCGDHGPIDMHKAHRVWSVLVLTSWGSSPALCCKSCGIKRQVGAIVFSFVFGWWGFPWGLGMTPIQIARNLAEIFSGPQTGKPSMLLQKVVRMQTAAAMVEQYRLPPKLHGTRQMPPPVPVQAVQSAFAMDDDSRYMPK